MAERIVNFSDASEKAKVLSYFRTLEGKHRVKVVRERKRRSDQQNRYYWGCVVKFVAAGLQEAWGETLTDDETHEFLKHRFLAKPVVNRKTGEIVGATVPTTTTLNTKEFNAEYLEQIFKFSAESLGVVIPLPNTDESTARRVAAPQVN